MSEWDGKGGAIRERAYLAHKARIDSTARRQPLPRDPSIETAIGGLVL